VVAVAANPRATSSNERTPPSIRAARCPRLERLLR
jgi:hypothetical protein